MTEVAIPALESLVAHLKEATGPVLDAVVSPVMEQMRVETSELAEELKKATAKVSLDLENNSGKWKGKTGVAGSRGGPDTAAVVNWLVTTLDVVVQKLNHHGVIMNSLLAHHEADMAKVKEEKAKVEKKTDELEKENDEIRQRSMKGNLIISTNTQGGKTSAFTKKLNPQGIREVESDLDMILRLVKEKTGVSFDRREVQAFHPISRRGEGQDQRKINSYVLRIWDLRPGSNWDTLRAGLMMGRDKDGNPFSDVNININYQLTRRRGQLAKAVRDARVELIREKKLKDKEVVFKYSHDENGVLRVKSRYGREGRWETIASTSALQQYIQKNLSYTFRHTVEG
jgi:hypothetical protein